MTGQEELFSSHQAKTETEFRNIFLGGDGIFRIYPESFSYCTGKEVHANFVYFDVFTVLVRTVSDKHTSWGEPLIKFLLFFTSNISADFPTQDNEHGYQVPLQFITRGNPRILFDERGRYKKTKSAVQIACLRTMSFLSGSPPPKFLTFLFHICKSEHNYIWI